MKKQVKLLAVVLTVFFALTAILTGCGTSNTNGGKTETTVSGSTAATTAEPSKKEEKPVEISYMVYMDMGNSKSAVKPAVEKLLQEKGYNVTFNMVEMGTTNPNEWGDKVKLAVASGENPPDIMQFPYIFEEARLGGWIASMDMSFIEQNMPKYVAQGKELDKNFFAMVTDIETGKILAIPSFNAYGPTRHTFGYRGDWLKNLGLEAPKTLDEFEVWLKKCRTEDPNKNGKNDEFGYSAEDTWHSGFNEVFAAFGVMPFQWHDVDGKLMADEVRPEAKQALAVIAKWYKEGLIPKGVLTTSKLDNDWNAGLLGTRVIYAPYGVPGGKDYENVVKMGGELVVTAPPKGPDGKYGTLQYGPKKYFLSFGKHLEKDQEKMAYIMKMFEFIGLDRTLYETATLGVKGVHWEFNDKAADKGPYHFLGDYTDGDKRLNEVGVKEMSESAFAPVWYKEVYQNYMDPKAVEYAAQNYGYFDTTRAIGPATNKKIEDELWTFSKTVYLDIIVGKKPVDYFDEYVKKWYDNGGTQLTEEVNKTYLK